MVTWIRFVTTYFVFGNILDMLPLITIFLLGFYSMYKYIQKEM